MRMTQPPHCERRQEGVPADVSVERASLALLLGDSARALELLGLGGGGQEARGPPNPEVLAYVQVGASGYHHHH